MRLAQIISNQDLVDLERKSANKFAGGTLSDIINLALQYLFPLAGLLLLLYLLYGGYNYMLSRGDPKAVEQAKGIITTAVIGFIIIFIAYWLVQIIGLILGLPDIKTVFG